jgi:CheY-like chemotaxis protein
VSSSSIAPEPVNILLVDDRPDNLTSLKALLQQPHYNLVLARSGEEALAQVLRRDFAVILLDVAMPGMDGFQTASVIKEREQSKRIPIIFITASVYEMEHVFRGYTVGAVDYLRKPLDAQAVRSKVAVFVELYRQRRRIEQQVARLQEAGQLRHQCQGFVKKPVSLETLLDVVEKFCSRRSGGERGEGLDRQMGSAGVTG